MRLLVVLLALAVGVGLVLAAEQNTRFWFAIWGLPSGVAVLTVSLLALFHAPAAIRYPVALLLATGAIVPWEMWRMEWGVTGNFGLDPSWRWNPSAEQRAVDANRDEALPSNSALPPLAAVTYGDWPGFRGAKRNGQAPAVGELVEVWRRAVGPGWGSVSGVGDRIFTQEQRFENEVVACYDLKSGRPLWRHEEEARHADGPSGAGPRATPTFHEGKLYALGATGVLVCLDAGSGKLAWKADVPELTGGKQPVFGCACSPLVHKGKVYIMPGVKGPALLALDAGTGKKLWQAGEQETESYSSPQWASLAGVEQVLAFSASGLAGHDPETGSVLWQYEWTAAPTAQPSVQPTVLPGARVVIGAAQPGHGMRCLKVSKVKDKWSAELEWETVAVTPRFNDVVYFNGCLYGLADGRVFCLDASNGEVRWKTRDSSFGTGQVLLVGERLLVQSEGGGLAWLDPKAPKAPRPERFEALKDKTWNHPALVRGALIVRNGSEMVCFGPK
jgi:outer membrane protein assembly factor BamB